MAEVPLVTVIVPIWNGERFLSQALDSVCAQTYQPLEIIAVDDGSQDASLAIASGYRETRCLRQTHQGVAAARNAGILAARGRLIALLDQDDVWLPEKLARQVAVLAEGPEVGFVLTRETLFLEPGIEYPSWLPPGALKEHVAWVPSALLVRRSLFDDIGLFDTSYEFASDSEWFFRTRDSRVPMAVVPEVLVRRRIHDANASHAAVSTAEASRIARESIRRKRTERERDRGASPDQRQS